MSRDLIIAAVEFAAWPGMAPRQNSSRGKGMARSHEQVRRENISAAYLSPSLSPSSMPAIGPTRDGNFGSRNVGAQADQVAAVALAYKRWQRDLPRLGVWRLVFGLGLVGLLHRRLGFLSCQQRRRLKAGKPA